MIVVMEESAPEEAIEAAIMHLVKAGCSVHRSSGQTRTILGVVGHTSHDDLEVVRELEGVAKVVRISEPFHLASRKFRGEPTVHNGDYGTIGGGKPWIAIEPIGLETTGNAASLTYRMAAARPFDAAVTREQVPLEDFGALTCLSVHSAPRSSRYPIRFVLREPSWGADTWIEAAEQELQRGGTKVVLLEAGGEYPSGARTLEIAAIARAKQRTHLPIVVDVASIAQQGRYTVSVASAAIGAGVDGVILRVFVGSDGERPRVPATLRWDQAVDLAGRLRAIGEALSR